MRPYASRSLSDIALNNDNQHFPQDDRNCVFHLTLASLQRLANQELQLHIPR